MGTGIGIDGHLVWGLGLFPSEHLRQFYNYSFLMRNCQERLDEMRVRSNFISRDYPDSDTEQTLSLIAPDPR